MIHDPDSFTFEIGKGEVLRDGTDVALIANGLLMAEALLEQFGLCRENIARVAKR